MDFPAISDGTVTLRPFTPGDVDATCEWLAGPSSAARSLTDGVPQTDVYTARTMAEQLHASDAYTIMLDEQAQGVVKMRIDQQRHGHCQIILASPPLWAQGIGARSVRLLCTVAFEHLKMKALHAPRVKESAEAARVTWENQGFGITRRFLDGDDVYLDFELGSVAHTSKEQKVLLICSGRTGNEEAGHLIGSSINPPLDGIGRAQAESLALNGAVLQVVECVTSPQKRAKATAEAAFVARDVPCAVEDTWQDRDWGEWSSQPFADLPRSEDGTFADPPGGESEKVFCKRVGKAFDALPYGGHLAVITHRSNIAALIRSRFPGAAEAPGLRSGLGIVAGSITECRRGPEGWRLIRLVDDRHLQARRATADLATQFPSAE